MIQKPCFWVSAWNFSKHLLIETCASLCSLQRISRWPRHGHNRSVFDRRLDAEDGVHTYSGALLSHEKRWDTAICSSMGGPWKCHASRSKSDRKSQEPYAFTHTRDMKLKATKKQTRQTKTHRHRQTLCTSRHTKHVITASVCAGQHSLTGVVGTRGKGVGEVGRVKRAKYVVTESCPGVVNTQYSIRMMYYRTVHPKPV